MKKYIIYRGEKEAGRYGFGELKRLIKREEVFPSDYLQMEGMETRVRVDAFWRRYRDDWRMRRATIAAAVSVAVMIITGWAMSLYRIKSVPEICYCMGIAFGVLSFLVFIRSRVAILLLVVFTAAILFNIVVELTGKPTRTLVTDALVFAGALWIYLDAALAIFRFHTAKRSGGVIPGAIP